MAFNLVGINETNDFPAPVEQRLASKFGQGSSGSGTPSVRTYGALGNGVTDDTTAIQSALNAQAGKALHFPAGTYISGSLTVAAGTTLFGDGPRSIIKARAALNTDLVKNALGASDITIRDLALNGNKGTMTSGGTGTTNPNRGIYLSNVARCLLTNLHIVDFEGHGVHLSLDGTQEGNRISDTVVERSGSGGLNTYGSNIAVTNGNGVTLTNVHAYDSAKAGFRLGGTGFTLNGCVARRNGNGGVVPVTGTAGLTINGGFYSDNVGPLSDGIRLVGVVDVTVNGVECVGNDGAGIAVYNSSRDVTITGGVFRNNGQGGVLDAVALDARDGITVNGETSAVTGVVVAGARCYDDQATRTQQYGIRLRGDTDFVTIIGSDVRNNQAGAYRNDSTTGTAILVGLSQGAATAYPIGLNTQTGTAYTLALADAGVAVEANNAAAVTLTVPPNTTAAFPIGTLIEVTQVGTGQVTVAAGTGVTLRTSSTLTTRARWSTVGLRKRGVNEWVVSGDLT